MTAPTPPDLPGAPPAAVICPGCGAALGREVLVGGRSWLLMGCAQLDAAHGVCACGVEFWWTGSSRRLERLIERVRRAHRMEPGPPGVDATEG